MQLLIIKEKNVLIITEIIHGTERILMHVLKMVGPLMLLLIILGYKFLTMKKITLILKGKFIP